MLPVSAAKRRQASRQAERAATQTLACCAAAPLTVSRKASSHCGEQGSRRAARRGQGGTAWPHDASILTAPRPGVARCHGYSRKQGRSPARNKLPRPLAAPQQAAPLPHPSTPRPFTHLLAEPRLLRPLQVLHTRHALVKLRHTLSLLGMLLSRDRKGRHACRVPALQPVRRPCARLRVRSRPPRLHALPCAPSHARPRTTGTPTCLKLMGLSRLSSFSTPLATTSCSVSSKSSSSLRQTGGGRAAAARWAAAREPLAAGFGRAAGATCTPAGALSGAPQLLA